MTKILEIKDKIIKFYGEYETYLYPVVKFILAFATFFTISKSIGYNARLSQLPVVLILSIICAIMPVNIIVLFAAVVILIDLYSLPLEAALIGAVLFLVIYFVYFRFAPKDGAAALLTPILFRFNIPHVLPIGMGLLREAYSVIAVVCGTVMYYFLDGVRINSQVLHGGVSVTEESTSQTSSKLKLLIGQVVGNKEMYMIIVIFVLTAVIVNGIRRLKNDYAWTIAIVAGVLVQTLGLVLGTTWLGITGKAVSIIVGNIIALIVGFVLQFIFMSIDYSRTERVQFEDDNYHYYVKAVPKKMVASGEKTIKHFGNTASMGKRIEKKAIVEELEIKENEEE